MRRTIAMGRRIEVMIERPHLLRRHFVPFYFLIQVFLFPVVMTWSIRISILHFEVVIPLIVYFALLETHRVSRCSYFVSLTRSIIVSPYLLLSFTIQVFPHRILVSFSYFTLYFVCIHRWSLSFRYFVLFTFSPESIIYYKDIFTLSSSMLVYQRK
jgi:hypothetical protein